MLTQHRPKQESLRAEISDATERFLASGGQINVVRGFTERKYKSDGKLDFEFKAVNDLASTRAIKVNPYWTNAAAVHKSMTASNIQQKSVAEAVGILPRQLNVYLHRRSNPTADLAKKIEQAVARLIAENWAEA